MKNQAKNRCENKRKTNANERVKECKTDASGEENELHASENKLNIR